MTKPPIVVAITGASGAPYAVRLLSSLTEAKESVQLIVSSHGLRLLSTEMGIDSIGALRNSVGRAAWDSCITTFDDADRGASPASGSALNAGMVVAVLDGTLSAIAAGSSRSLVGAPPTSPSRTPQADSRAARDALSAIHLENMLRVTRAGAVVLPAAPGSTTSIDRRSRELRRRACARSPRCLALARPSLERTRRGVTGMSGMSKARHVIWLISDTHGLVRPDVHTALAGVELILHAGDVGGGDVLAELTLIAPVRAVRGNTDPPDEPPLPAEIELTVGGVRIHVSHGHEVGSPNPKRLLERYDADVIVYGHTHKQLVTHAGDRWVVRGARHALSGSISCRVWPSSQSRAEASRYRHSTSLRNEARQSTAA
jgi:putative phosphoesterase